MIQVAAVTRKFETFEDSFTDRHSAFGKVAVMQSETCACGNRKCKCSEALTVKQARELAAELTQAARVAEAALLAQAGSATAV